VKLSRNGFYGVFALLLALLPAIIGGCELVNTSLADYFLDNSEIVQAVGFEVKTEHAIKDGTILIPPGETTLITIALANPRSLGLRQSLVGVPEGKSIAVRQNSPLELEVSIAGAEEGDDYGLTLALQSADGLRDFPSYPLRTLCVSFETKLANFELNGTKLPSFDAMAEAFAVSIPFSQTSAVLAGTTAHAGATIALYAGTEASGQPLATGTHRVELNRVFEVGNNHFCVKITAPSMSEQGYAITVYRASPLDTGISEFYFTISGKKYGYGTGVEPGSGTIMNNEISITVPYGTDITSLPGTVTKIGASIDPDPATLLDYSSPKIYTVTDTEGLPMSYTVTVKEGPGTTINGIIFDGLGALSFTPSSTTASLGGSQITITLSPTPAATVVWYIDISGPAPSTPTSTTGSFDVPTKRGFYNVNVIATVGGVDYSGSFGLIVE
jgi:hypothetical protein